MPWMGSWIMIIPSDFIHKALNRPFEDVQSSTSPGRLFSPRAGSGWAQTLAL